MNRKAILHAELALLLLVSALAYLPFLSRLGYYKDDWYLMYLAHSQGPGIFKDIFSIDRPARAFVMSAAYELFQDIPLYYNISAYGFRLLGALGFLWALRLLWPSQRTATILAALLYLVYPGYLSQVNAIDYQSYTLSLFLAMFSIALTFKAVQSPGAITRFFLGGVAILLGWGYLALVEYFIGLEAFRFLGLLLIAIRRENAGWISAIRGHAARILAFMVIPVLFLAWRIFIFQNERRATDLGFQLGALGSLRWPLALAWDSIKVVFAAWAVPLYNAGLRPGLLETGLGLALAGAAAAALVFFLWKTGTPEPPVHEASWRREAFWLGVLSALAGLLPIILANRYVDFAEYSRYALPAAAGGVILVVSLLYQLPGNRARIAAVSLLLLSAVYVHYVNGAAAARETGSVGRFWWEVSWRAPGIARGTTLIAKYSAGGIPEDYVIWGPANLVYYPEPHPERPLETDLSAALLMNDTVAKVYTGLGNESEAGRGTLSNRDYRKILVLTRPTEYSCVRILDGSYAEVSIDDDPGIAWIAGKSDTGNILLDAAQRTPPQAVFGREPAHDWCYYYQKAALARQQGKWETVARLGEQAIEQRMHPDDQVEWMPFLQAYALEGNRMRVKEISTKINTERFYKYQACQNLRGMAALSPEMRGMTEELFCGGK